MAVTPFINIFRTKEEAFYFKNSQINTQFIFKGVQLLPNNASKYIQVTETPNGIDLEDWTVFAVDLCKGTKTEITPYFFVDSLTNSIDGSPQLFWSLTNVPFDFGYRLIYLEINQSLGETFNAIADSAQQAGEIIAGFSEMNFKNEYARLEAQKDISLKFAGDSTAAKQKIEDDYEKRRKEIANRENKAKQKQAIFNIAIDTAQAIMATVGKTGFAGLPLALILGALGAAQIAMVASQKIPEYWQGTDNASAGLAYTNERGAEIHTDKHGNIKDFGDNKGARLTMMAQGDKVYTAEETKRMMFNDDLNYMLNSRGISMPINSQSNTMTAQQMDLILGKHFSKIQTNSTVIDKNGFAQWTEKRGNRTIQNANRVSRTGFKV